ncbi:helix-turn-helix transcriptional regulator [Paenibacillus sp. NPDC056579]|uniref:helix-turn-helix transcriptional regulator n=1 Tax=Paenibacillus sp. NPDC056579 TaxID=3345871 RepID=UPI0036D18E33
MLPFILANSNPEQLPPLYIYCIGYHEQKHIYRPTGFPVYQFFLTRKGSGMFRIFGKEELILSEGSLLLLGKGVPHEYFPSNKEEGWELGFIGFQGDASGVMATLIGSGKPMTVSEERFQLLWTELIELWHSVNDHESYSVWDASRRLYSILLTLQEVQIRVDATSASHVRNQPNQALQHATRFLEEHYNEDLHLANVAYAVGYSVQHLHRLFSSAYGVTPNRYLQMIRLRRALQLFQLYPGITIEEAAGQVGMETSYFIKMFKKIYGTTPKQYVMRYIDQK